MPSSEKIYDEWLERQEVISRIMDKLGFEGEAAKHDLREAILVLEERDEKRDSGRDQTLMLMAGYMPPYL